MSGAKALMEEIKRNHYTETDKDVNTANPEANRHESTPPVKDEMPVKRQRRKRKARVAVPEETNSLVSPNAGLFTVMVVGGMKLPGYPLNEGEKLVIAKLTPISIGT